MRNITLETAAKEVLIREFGKDAVAIDKELNELSKLVVKRKDVILSLNKGVYTEENKKRYYEIDGEIKKIIGEINEKLALV